MHKFFGKTIKYTLWLVLVALLSAFLFGLLRFKGDLVAYVNYLNQIDVRTVFSSSSSGQVLSDEEILEDVLQDLEFSGALEDDMFLPELSSGNSLSGEASLEVFGFSGNIETSQQTGSLEIKTQSGSINSGSSVSKEDLLHLIKLREK